MKSTFQKELHLKDYGMESSAAAHVMKIFRVRQVAKMIATDRGKVSMNEVRAAMPGVEFGNWSGSIFKDGNFMFTGEYVPARYKGAHARDIKVWKLK